MKTLISIGGWTYRDDFSILSNMTSDQLITWALNVKETVDLFEADGIGIDYEAETQDQWENELI